MNPDVPIASDQYELDLAVVPRASSLRLWILAAEGGAVSTERRHLLVDSSTAAPLLPSSDAVLVRQSAGTYSIFASEQLPGNARRELLAVLTSALSAPELRIRRVTSVVEVTDIALGPGRSRGELAANDDDVRSRTGFEHALLRVAGRHRAGRMPGAMRAVHLAERVSEDGAHPIVHGLFRREHGDMLREMYVANQVAEFGRAAVPLYGQAARAFDALGLHHQARVTRALALDTWASVEQPWLPGLPRPEGLDPTRAGLGYTVRRLSGFAIALDPPIAVPSAPGTAGALVHAGDVGISDERILSLLAGIPCARQRAVAVVDEHPYGYSVQAGLSEEMHAYLGVLPDSADYRGVTAIMLEGAEVVDGASVSFRPNGPVTFKIAPPRPTEEVAVRVAMAEDDDMLLRFTLKPRQDPRRIYI